MEELTPALVASLPKSTVTARIRFIPKADGMRPITRVIGADAKTRVFIYFFSLPSINHQECTLSFSSIFPPAALPRSCSGLARHPASLRPLQTGPAGLHGVEPRGHPQSAVSRRPGSEGQAAASLLRQSWCLLLFFYSLSKNCLPFFAVISHFHFKGPILYPFLDLYL